MSHNGFFTLHGTGNWTGTRDGTGIKFVLIYCTEMFTLVHDRKRNTNPLFPIVPVQFPVPVLVLFPCSANKPEDLNTACTGDPIAYR